MVLTNIEVVPGKKIVEHYGLVQGSTIRAKHLGRDIAASFKNIFGGELEGYTELLSESCRTTTRYAGARTRKPLRKSGIT